MLNRTRRLAALGAAALASTALVAAGGGGAQAATGAISYSCALPASGLPIPISIPFDFDQDTSSPTGIYVGTKFTPTYSVQFKVPAAALAVSTETPVKSFDGEVKASITANGVPITVTAIIPKTAVPASDNPISASDVVLTGTGPLPLVSGTGAGQITYLPGNLAVSVNAYGAPAEEGGDEPVVFTTKDAEGDGAPCTLPAEKANTPIDKIVVVKVPTTATSAISYSKSTKLVSGVARIAAKNGTVPVGVVSATLYRGGNAVKQVKVTLQNGYARTNFGATAKGTYKIAFVYAGTGTYGASNVNSAGVVLK